MDMSGVGRAEGGGDVRLAAHAMAMPVTTTCLQFQAAESLDSVAFPARFRRCGRYRLSAPTARKVSEPEMSKKRSVEASTLGSPAANWTASAAPTEGTMVRRRGDLKLVMWRRRLMMGIVAEVTTCTVLLDEMETEEG